MLELIHPISDIDRGRTMWLETLVLSDYIAIKTTL